RQAARINRLASGLLDLERISQGVLQVELTDVVVAEAAEEAVASLHTADVTVDVDAALGVRADPDRLQQILVNLAANALRHGEPPVLVQAREVGTAVEVSVRDYGKGVPESVEPALFEQFSTGEPGRQGIGLGLWIVQQLAWAQGGDVRYEPADPGARFVVTLPAAEPAVPR